MSKLTKETRDGLPADDFAVPGKRALPMHDEKHTRMAWDMVSKTKDLTPAERKEARRRIIERAHKFGIDTSDWDEKRLNASAEVVYAMSLNIANDDDHPNKAPFKGVLTRIDEPSDRPPEGSGGRRIVISAEAARNALPTLLCMGVDYVPDLDGHDPQKKIGIITAATVDGDAKTIPIEGFLYKADFPDVVEEIKANKDALGFSYEARKLFVVDPDADPIVVTACTFTGAAILRKDKAAYRSTSISAKADKSTDMTEDEIKKLLEPLTSGLTTLTAQFTKLSASVEAGTMHANEHTRAMIEPHAKALENCAAAMEAAGIGGDPKYGHATFARKMAAHMRAASAMGQIPHIFREHDFMHAAADKAGDTPDLTKQVGELMKPFTDQLAALGTQIADVKAAATRTATPPERKTLPAVLTQLLAKAGVEPDKSTGKLEIATVDKMLKDAGITDPSERLKMKSTMRQHGVID